MILKQAEDLERIRRCQQSATVNALLRRRPCSHEIGRYARETREAKNLDIF